MLLLSLLPIGVSVAGEENGVFDQYVLTVDKTGQGTTLPNVGEHVYEEGAEVLLKATPDAGWQFEKWVIGSEDTIVNK